MKANLIEIAFPVNDFTKAKGVLPTARIPQYIIERIDLEILSESLNKLIGQVGKVLSSAKSIDSLVSLDSVSISAEINASSGIQWIGSLQAGETASIVLNFKIKNS